MTAIKPPTPLDRTHGHPPSPGDDKPVTEVMADAHISRGIAWAMAAAFMLCICIPPLHQSLHELATDGGWSIPRLFHEFPTAASLKRFENDLSRDSLLAKRVRGPYQDLVTSLLGQGTEKIVVGRDGFLFFRKEIDLACGPGAQSAASRRRRIAAGTAQDPVEAIADFRRQLDQRGIHLVFMLVPVKPVIYPEEVWAGYPAASGPAWNLDHEIFMRRLAAVGVDALDITPDLWAGKEAGRMFLARDTHWSQRGLGIAADRLAEKLRDFMPHPVPGMPTRAYVARAGSIANSGDLLGMLGIAARPGRFALETAELTQTLVDGAPAIANDPEAPILLLGDSYTNIYSSRDLGWGEGAGLAQQLMRRLGQGVFAIAKNGGGASDVRQALANEPAPLEHAKVVVWEVSARDLYDEAVAWRIISLPAGRVAKPKPTPAHGIDLVIEGELISPAVGPIETDGTYENALATLKLRVTTVVSGTFDQETVLFQTPVMLKRQLQPAASLVPGARLRVRLSAIAPPGVDQWKTYDLEGEFDQPLWAEGLEE